MAVGYYHEVAGGDEIGKVVISIERRCTLMDKGLWKKIGLAIGIVVFIALLAAVRKRKWNRLVRNALPLPKNYTGFDTLQINDHGVTAPVS